MKPGFSFVGFVGLVFDGFVGLVFDGFVGLIFDGLFFEYGIISRIVHLLYLFS